MGPKTRNHKKNYLECFKNWTNGRDQRDEEWMREQPKEIQSFHTELRKKEMRTIKPLQNGYNVKPIGCAEHRVKA